MLLDQVHHESKFIFFWGGPLSQWFKCTIIIDGVTYNCAEQYMMAMKAQYFGDTIALIQIMKAKDPRTQKLLGRSVKNFDANQWSKVARHFVYKANLAKFSDPKLKQILLDTGDKEIVEASPTDTIWGIGLAEDNPARFDKSQWRGTNWLGQILMQVREELQRSHTLI